MCRFALYLGPPLTLDALVTRPANSIIHQSFDSRERSGRLNPDGFGLAWYVPEISPEPALFRSITPAWSDRNLRHLARVTKSPCILAHVRAASPGLPVTESNCHPFVSGPYAFMHNGGVGGFPRLRRRLRESLSDEAEAGIEGTTDSELLFALFLDERRRARGAAAAAMADALLAVIERVREAGAKEGVEEPHHLNLAVTDGTRAVVSRFTSGPPEAAPSLYVHEGRCYVCEEGVCRMVEPEAGHGAVIVCSEPLSADPGWARVAPNHVVVVAGHRHKIALRPIPA